jgi:DNA-binding NarL/FixJ family response regulator
MASRSHVERLQLTPREQAVVELILTGKGNKEIASALGCSTKTIEFHTKNVFRKAGVDSRLALACKLMQPT